MKVSSRLPNSILGPGTKSRPEAMHMYLTVVYVCINVVYSVKTIV